MNHNTLLYRLAAGALMVLAVGVTGAQDMAVGRPSVTVSVDGALPGDVTVTTPDRKQDLADGRISNQFTAKVSASLGLFRKKLGHDRSHTLAAALLPHYSLSTTSLDDTELQLAGYDLNVPDRHTRYGVNLMAMYNGHVGHVPLMVMAMPFVDFSQYGYERTGAILYAMVTLKRTESTQFGVSAVGLLGTSSPWPVFPCIYLTHKWGEQWGVSINGRYNSLYYKPSKSLKLSAVADMQSAKYYLRPSGDNLPDKAVLTQSYFKTGLQCDYDITSHLSLNALVGARLPMNSKICPTHGSTVYLRLRTPVSPTCHLSLKYKI